MSNQHHSQPRRARRHEDTKKKNLVFLLRVFVLSWPSCCSRMLLITRTLLQVVGRNPGLSYLAANDSPAYSQRSASIGLIAVARLTGRALAAIPASATSTTRRRRCASRWRARRTTHVAEARPGAVVFISEIQPGAPRYRLAYTEGTGNTLTGRFEVAPPGKPDAFAPYLSWTARKVQR